MRAIGAIGSAGKPAALCRLPPLASHARQLLCCLSLWALTAHAAESLYKYRDANGNLVYSDRAPDTSTGVVQSLRVSVEEKPPSIEVREMKDHDQRSLVAVNECRCVVEYELRVLKSTDQKLQTGATVHEVLPPQSEKILLALSDPVAQNTPQVQWAWKAILGSPTTVPATDVLYRAPFALGSSYRITQAYPRLITHTSVADQYALDIALPDGTPVYAARDGLVINLQHDKFLTAAAPIMLDQANMVEILHDDGTIAIYAHLHWDSVRVRPGQRVRRGDYLADSGNTGFSTGPHLHFGVMYNAGLAAHSIPVRFQGAGGSAVTPQPDMMLTAY